MHDFIIMMQIFNDMKFDLKSHLRSHKVTFMFKNEHYSNMIFFLNLIISKFSNLDLHSYGPLLYLLFFINNKSLEHLIVSLHNFLFQVFIYKEGVHLKT